MIRTLVFYDGKMSSAQRISSQLSYMIGHTKTAELEEAPEDLSPYGGLCFVFNFYGPVTAEKTRIAESKRSRAFFIIVPQFKGRRRGADARSAGNGEYRSASIILYW